MLFWRLKAYRKSQKRKLAKERREGYQAGYTAALEEIIHQAREDAYKKGYQACKRDTTEAENKVSEREEKRS